MNPVDTKSRLAPLRVWRAGFGVLMTGRAHGNCNVASPVTMIDGQRALNARGVRNVSGAISQLSYRRALIAKPSFNSTRVLKINPDLNCFAVDRQDNLWRATDEADAVLLDYPGEAVIFCSADCLMAVVYSPLDHRLVVAHLGLRCLVPEDRNDPTLLETVVREFESSQIKPRQLRVWLGGGADECCYGHEDNQAYPIIAELRQRVPEEPFRLPVMRGPRRGQIAISQRKLALLQCRKLGIGKIEVDPLCTSCASTTGNDSDEPGIFYSNLRERSDQFGRKVKYRNAFAVKLREC